MDNTESQMDSDTATIFHVDRPEPLLVAINSLRHCPKELGTEFWPPSKRPSKKTKDTGGPSAQSEKEETETSLSSPQEVEIEGTMLDSELLTRSIEGANQHVPTGAPNCR